MGVKRVGVPNRSTKSPEKRREQKKRWFRNGQKWRTGCEGHTSVIKRRHRLSRCRYKTEVRMQRWVGLGVISDNLVNMGRVMSRRPTRCLAHPIRSTPIPPLVSAGLSLLQSR